MQVLLRQDVARLGKGGDVVTVKDGYARNFLLPKGIAIKIADNQMKVIEAERRRLAKAAEQERLAVEELTNKIKDVSITITAKANEEGHLFGSVGPAEIAETLSNEVAQVEEAAVRLDPHIKDLGVYDVPIHISGETEVVIKVWVVGE